MHGLGAVPALPGRTLQPRADARRRLRPAETGHLLQAGLPPRRAGGCGVPDAELLPLLRGKGVHRDTHLSYYHAGGAARPVRAVRPEEMGGVPFQGGQGGGHPERKAHPPQKIVQGGGGRILPPLHGLPLPPRPVLHEQLQGFGRVPEGGRPRGALLSAGGHRRDKPALTHQALHAGQRKRLSRRHRPVLVPDQCSPCGLRGVQPGGADTRPAQAAEEAPGQGQASRLHARPEQPDSQGRHRGGLGKTCRGQLPAGLRQLQHPGELPGGQGHPGHFLPGDQAVRMRHHALSHGLQPAGAVHRQLPRQCLRLQSRLRPVPYPVGRRSVLLLQGTPEGIGGHAPDHVLHRPAGAARLHRHHGQGGQGEDDRQRQLLLYRAKRKRQVVSLHCMV